MRLGVWERICLDASESHEAALKAVHALEITLVRTGSENPDSWRRIRDDLDALVDRLRLHRDQSEELGGLITEMEVIQGRSTYVTEVEHAHNEVIAAAESLRRQLAADSAPHVLLSKLHREASLLTEAERKHQYREIDLIYETFWRDRVGGD